MLNHIALIFLLVALGGTLMIGNILGPAFAQVPGFWSNGAPFTDPRSGSGGIEGAAASHISGKIYVSHGFEQIIGDTIFISSYDIATDTWTHGGAGLPDAPGTPRAELAGAAALAKHYAIGGRPGPSAAVEEFDPVAGTWATKMSMPTARATEHSAVEVAGKIYVIGGRTGGAPASPVVLSANEKYDPVADAWAPLSPIPIAVSDTVTLAFNNKIYVFGGFDVTLLVTNHVQIYDIATDTWNAGTPMPTARASLQAGMCGSNMHLIGGVDNTLFPNLQTHEVYDPITDSWSVDLPVPVGTSEIQAVSAANKIFLIGNGLFGNAGTDHQIWNCEQDLIGGEFLPIETTSLILAGAQTFSWMIPVVLSVVGIGLFVVSRKSENS